MISAFEERKEKRYKKSERSEIEAEAECTFKEEDTDDLTTDK